MKSFVVMTYYQLMHSIAMALTLDEKPMLYFSKSYLDVQEDFLDRIRESGIFHDVVGITARGEFVKFIAELNETKDYTPEEIDRVGDSIFEKHLEPMYAEPFKDADFEDTIYVYNDFQWHYYYIHKHFKHIVGIEDGYASLKQQLKIHSFKGDHQLVIKFLGKYYPEPLYRSQKIKEIISSKFFDDIPEEYKEKLHIIDFNDLIGLHSDQYRDALLFIFDIADYIIEDNSVLFLSQPLSRAKYCNSLQEYLLYKKLLHKEVAQGKKVYFKAHPADSIDPYVYKDKDIFILPKSFPVELLNYKNCTFQKVLSFASTGVKTLTCAKSFEKLFQNQNAGADEIKNYIEELVEGEDAILKIVYLVDQFNTDTYVNVFSGCNPPGKNLRTTINVVVPSALSNKAAVFFDKTKLKTNIDKYKKKHSKNGICIWETELNKLERKATEIKSPTVFACDNLYEEKDILRAIGEDDVPYDYILIVSARDPLFSVIRNIKIECQTQFASCIVFQNYTKIPERKMRFPYIPTSPGHVDGQIHGSLINKVWQRSLFEDISNKSEGDRVRVIKKNYSTFAMKFTNDLFVPFEMYINISDGCNYYLEKMNLIAKEETNDSETMVLLLAKEVLDYLDWIKVKDVKAGPLDEFIDQINCPETIKRLVLEKVCLTLYYEQNKRYKRSANDNFREGQFLLKEVGMSEKIIKGKRTINRLKKIVKH